MASATTLLIANGRLNRLGSLSFGPYVLVYLEQRSDT